jgi:hypothetical protein
MNRGGRVLVGGWLVAAAVTLAACTADAPDEAPTSMPPRPAATYTLPTPEPGAHGSDEEDQPTQVPVPVCDEAARASAESTAAAALTAFARPDLDHSAWWEGFSPFLAPAAAPGYVATDPVNIPVSQVTGPARLLEEDSPYLARVRVPTDAGPHDVLLSRTDAAAGWLVEQIIPAGADL